MTIETTERRDFLKTLVKAGLAGAATVALATQAQAEKPVDKKPQKGRGRMRQKIATRSAAGTFSHDPA